MPKQKRRMISKTLMFHPRGLKFLNSMEKKMRVRSPSELLRVLVVERMIRSEWWEYLTCLGALEHLAGFSPTVRGLREEHGLLSTDLIKIKGDGLGRLHVKKENADFPEKSNSPHIWEPITDPIPIGDLERMIFPMKPWYPIADRIEYQDGLAWVVFEDGGRLWASHEPEHRKRGRELSKWVDLSQAEIAPFLEDLFPDLYVVPGNIWEIPLKDD